MKLGILRAPHQNARYFDATQKLLKNEVLLTAQALGQEIENLCEESFGGLVLLTFETPALDPRFELALGRIGANLVTFEIGPHGLMPRHENRDTYFPKDMASILKYGGKTNEEFTALMLNVAVMSGDYAKLFDTPLSILDPMCGRGTSLYQGLMNGYNMAGLDQDKTAISEMATYVKRYLKYHLYKHDFQEQTIHQDGKRIGMKYTVETANTIEAFKNKDRRLLQFALGDTRAVNGFYKKGSFHGVVVDLPYGVQHRAKEGDQYVDLVTVLAEAAPQWHKVLKKGGTVVIAYNTYHLKRELIDPHFEAAGYEVLKEGVYSEFEHWVEQAVNRDLLVYKKR